MEPFEEEKLTQAEQLPEAEQMQDTAQQNAEPQQETAQQAAQTAPESAAPAETPEADAAEQKDAQSGSFFGDLMDLMESVIVSVFTVMLVFTFLVCTADVEGTSMVPTLENEDRLLVNRIDKHYSTGDILIIDSDKARMLDESGSVYESPGLEKRIVKRLIAQSGQQVDINFDAGIVYVDGEALDEPYTSAPTHRDNGAFVYPFTVPEGYVFVLGDNRPVSKDSRSPEIGLVPVDNIVGRVILRISPFDSFGKIR